MRQRGGRINLFTVIIILALAGTYVMVDRFGPYYWDYGLMKEATKSAVRTWKMAGRQAGEEKLSDMIEDKDMSDYIEASFCDFTEHAGTARVRCSWEVDVFYPFSDKTRTLSFYTEHEEEMDGN